MYICSPVHGTPQEALIATNKKVKALKDKLISVTLKCSDNPDSKEYIKKLPRKQCVYYSIYMYAYCT